MVVRSKICTQATHAYLSVHTLRTSQESTLKESILCRPKHPDALNGQCSVSSHTHARMHKLSVTALFICKHTSCQPSSPVLSLTLSLENCLGCFVTVCVCIVSLIPRKKKIGYFDLSVDCFFYLNHFSSVI